jgi:hypothetical protein
MIVLIFFEETLSELEICLALRNLKYLQGLSNAQVRQGMGMQLTCQSSHLHPATTYVRPITSSSLLR